MRLAKQRSFLLLLSSIVMLSTSLGGCVKRGIREEIFCPQPSNEEIEDFESLDPDRPVSIWMSRVIGYCWHEYIWEGDFSE